MFPIVKLLFSCEHRKAAKITVISLSDITALLEGSLPKSLLTLWLVLIQQKEASVQ